MALAALAASLTICFSASNFTVPAGEFLLPVTVYKTIGIADAAIAAFILVFCVFIVVSLCNLISVSGGFI